MSELGLYPWCGVSATKSSEDGSRGDWGCGSFQHGIEPWQSKDCENNQLTAENEQLREEIDALRGALSRDDTQRLMAEAVLREEEIERLKDHIADFQAVLREEENERLKDHIADFQATLREGEIERLTEELAQSQERATVRKRERDAARDVGRLRGGER